MLFSSVAILLILPKNLHYVRFEVFMVMTMKKSVLWDVTPCGFCKDQRVRGRYRLYHYSNKNWRARNNVRHN
jgi:hypothetical protein